MAMLDCFDPDAIPTAALPSSRLPDSYFILDLKTSGVGLDDVIVQIGHMLVLDGGVDSMECQLLDWTGRISLTQLQERLAQVPNQTSITVSALQSHGNEPLAILAAYRDMIGDIRCELPIVGHSVFAFDMPFLQRQLARWLGDHAFDPLRVNVWDVGLMDKATQGEFMIWEGESTGEFHQRVNRYPLRGVRWSLDHCLARHGIKVPVPPTDPAYSLWAARELYEVHRKIMNGLPQWRFTERGPVAVNSARLVESL